MNIEIVSHCYAVEHPHFAAALNYQLASLLLYPPTDCEVSATVCYNPDDPHTSAVLNYFHANGLDDSIKLIALSVEQFHYRCIGRNMAALHSTADVVWFTDCDYVFRGECFDTLARFAEQWPDEVAMVFPADIQIHCSHDQGDHDLALASEPGIHDIDTRQFIDKHYARAIGGVQVVSGEAARQYGYLDQDEKWQATGEGVLRTFRDDIAYRSQCFKRGSVDPIAVPGIYRLRHGRTTYQ